MLLCGCIPTPATVEIRVRADISDANKRVLAIQLQGGRGTAASEHVVYHGVLTSSQLEGTLDTLDGFLGGYALVEDVNKGELRFIVQEDGVSQVINLRERDVYHGIRHVRLDIPCDLSAAKAEWQSGSVPNRDGEK